MAERISRPADPQWWGDYVGPATPLYHGTSWPRAQRILREGLVPWNEQEDRGYWPSNYGNEFEHDWLEPRPGHVYLTQDSLKAQGHANDARDPETDRDTHGVVLSVDPSYLDPKLINPDEDAHPRPHQEDWDEHDPNGPDPNSWFSRGDMAHDLGWGDNPLDTQNAIEKHGLIAYNGTIPPEAISVKHVVPSRSSTDPVPVVTPGQVARPDQSGPFAPEPVPYPGLPATFTGKVSTWVDPLDELQQYMQSLGEAPESVAPSVHHNTEFDFASEPVVSPLSVPSPYPPGHEPKPVSDGPGGLSAGPTQRPNLLAKIKGFFKRTDALPSPQHSLNWAGPGKPGKGIYYNDTGQVFTWNVNANAEPHHSDMHREFRPDVRTNFLDDGHVPFNISPFGMIDNSWQEDGYIDPPQVNDIRAADPRLKPGQVNNDYGFGHGRNVLDKLDGYYSASKDELHYALEIPEHVKDKIREWADKQDWPEGSELESPDEYHITLLYSEDGHEDHHDADWLYPTDGYDVKVVAVDEFGEDPKAIVLRIESNDPLLDHANDLLDAAENRGLGVSRFPGGYKPHLTVAYAPHKPPYIRHPKLYFTTGPASVSEPRTAAVRGMGRPLHHIRPHVHYHPYTGLPCTCPWGQPADNKAKHPMYREAGSQNVRKLRNQNQKVFRDEYGQNYLKALDQLVEYHPDIEPMVPWIASRAKHDDIVYHPGRDELLYTTDPDRVRESHMEVANREYRRNVLDQYSHFQDADNLPPDYQAGEGITGYVKRTFPATYTPPNLRELAEVNNNFRPVAETVGDWSRWNNARQHPQRRGVVFDKLPVSDLHTRVQQFRIDQEEKRKKERWLAAHGGLTPPIHTFDSGPYTGWTVNQLRNVDDCEAESAALGHCIGDETQPYRGNVDAGNIEAYSLRDQDGYPHATWHYNPDGSLAHAQGRSGSPMEDYRDLISAWANKTGYPDEEVGEQELENLEHGPCPDCGYQLDEHNECENCGYPNPCPNCGQHDYDESEGCQACDYGVKRCPHCGARGVDTEDGDECPNCGYPHDSEIELPQPTTTDEYMNQYHPLASPNEMAENHGNVGPNTNVFPGTPDWDDILADATTDHPKHWEDFVNTVHHNYHAPGLDQAIERYESEVLPRGVTPPARRQMDIDDEFPWGQDSGQRDPDYDNFIDTWNQNRNKHYTQQGVYQLPQWTYGLGDYVKGGWSTAFEHPQLFNETNPHQLNHANPANQHMLPAYDYSPANSGGWDLPTGQPVPAGGGNPMGIGGGWYGGVDGACPFCGRMDRHMHDEGTTGPRTASDTQDPYICRHCMKPALDEPKPVPGDWRWHQTCTNCGRATSMSPTHPIVQALKNAQPQYPALLNEVAQPRPLGEWMASYDDGEDDGPPCPYCGQDHNFFDGHPGVARSRTKMDPSCPKCGSWMQWRDAAGLSGLWPQGAWECTNQRCWHMLPPGELAPDTVPQEMTNDWQPEGWDDETEHPLGPHTGSVRYSAVRSWTKGQWGKGLVDNNDIVHVWPDTPEHEHVSTLLDNEPQVNFLVNPGGGFLLQGGRQGRDGWHQFIQDQVPELWPMPQLRTQPGQDLQDAGDDDMIT